MTLQEAIKSELPFKRKQHNIWLSSLKPLISGLSFEDILANDWETFEETITITKTALTNAIFEATLKSKDRIELAKYTWNSLRFPIANPTEIDPT